MKNCIIYSVFFIGGCAGIAIPDKSWVSERLGVLAEPDTLILHYEKAIFTTVGLRFALLPDINSITGRGNETCRLGPIRLAALTHLNNSVLNYFDSIPRHFDSLSDHYCIDNTLDCFIPSEHNFKKGTDSNLTYRSKRQVVASVMVLAGVAAAATGLYHYFSRAELDDHLELLDSKIALTQNWLTDSLRSNEQYAELSENIFTKLYHGILNDENMLKESICQIADDEKEKTVYLEYSSKLEIYKENFNRAMDGEVTDFLISSDFLRELMKNRPELKKTIYAIDPGMFFLASSSSLTRVDTLNKIAYFTIATPILEERDISPLYTVYNYGWRDQEVSFKYLVPSHFYFLTEGARFKVATSDLSKCRMKKNTHICHTREAKLDRTASCIHSMIIDNSTEGCEVIATYERPTCFFETTKGGLFMLGCGSYRDLSSFRGVSESTEYKVNPHRSRFIPYSKFERIVIGTDVISTRSSYLRIHNSKIRINQNPNLEQLAHLMIPGMEHNLNDLRTFREKQISNLDGRLKDLMDQGYHTSYWKLIATILILFNICLVMWLLYKNLIHTPYSWIRRKILTSDRPELPDRIGEKPIEILLK